MQLIKWTILCTVGMIIVTLQTKQSEMHSAAVSRLLLVFFDQVEA